MKSCILKSQMWKIVVIFFAALLLAQSTTTGQGTFANLDFEHPILPLNRGPVSAADAFPSWTIYSAVAVFYDDVSIGGSAVSLHDANGAIPIFQGSYTALLQPNFPGGNIIPALGQVGTVPSTAQSVRFFGNGNYILSFAGQQIPLSVIANTPNYNVFGGDISAFVNQTGELRINGGGSLDNIFFSNQSIPEPSALGLFSLGTLLFGYRSRRRAD
jgi:hypothetical protein